MIYILELEQAFLRLIGAWSPSCRQVFK